MVGRTTNIFLAPLLLFFFSFFPVNSTWPMVGCVTRADQPSHTKTMTGMSQSVPGLSEGEDTRVLTSRNSRSV